MGEAPTSLARSRLLGSASAVGAATLFSANGALSALAYARGSTPLALSFWRTALGSLIAAALVGIGVARGRRPFAGTRPTRSAATWLAVAIAAITIENLAVFGAFRETSVVVALVVFYTYPVLVGAASAALRLEPMDGRRAAALLATFLGCVLVVAGAGGDAQFALAGAALAFVGAVGQTVYVLAARHGFGGVPMLETSLILQLGPAILLAVLALATGIPLIDAATFGAALAVIYLVSALLGQTTPMLLYLTGVRTIGPVNTAALALIEPFMGALIAWAVVGQPFGALQVVGGILVVASALLVQGRGVETPPALG